MEKFHSLPNIRGTGSAPDLRRLYSVSLSQIKKHASFAEYHHKPSPFSIRWIHGYNSRAGVYNLNENGSTTLFYAASNCGVLYNWTTNQMRILQGHRHMVTLITMDAQGKWLVTADSGPENIVIIWDSIDVFPQKTIFLPHGPAKLSKVAISADAKYLLTLAYPGQTAIYWWIWSFEKVEPHATITVDLPPDSVIQMEFNPYNSSQLFLMTRQDIWIGISKKVFVFERGLWKETDDYELKIRCVPKKLNSEIGRLTCFTVVRSTSQVVAASRRGAVIIYGYTIEHQREVDDTNYENLRFVKVLKIEKNKINVIKNIDGFIVTGNDVGQIHFYDDQLKLLYWTHGISVDSVMSLSFNISPRSYKIFDPQCNQLCPCWEKIVVEVDSETGAIQQKLLKKRIPSDATTEGKPMVIRDFIVCTKNQGVGYVDFVVEKWHTVLDNTPSNALSLSVHPEKPFVCVGYANSIIELVNYVQHNLFVRLNLSEYYKVVTPPDDDSICGDFKVTVPQISVTCLKYSPSGLHLACGMDTGQLIFLDPTTIAILTDPPFQNTSHPIKEINYSCDSLTMACADSGKITSVYKYNCKKLKWVFVGKLRAHYKDITSIIFLPEKNADGEYKLLSLGADRVMVEYNVSGSCDEQLKVVSVDRVEQSAVPLAAVPWQALGQPSLPTVITANDEYKYKIVNHNTAMTLATVLGPRYDCPVSRLQLVSRTEDQEQLQYLLFATKNTIGLQRMPLDGNPWKHIGLLAHPLQIIGTCYREDTGTLFTIGAKDSTMFQWAANYRSVDSTMKQGGGDLDPYYCLIENGRPGWLFQEIRDLFYYIQILCQGTFSPAMRHVKDYIPIDSLPDLMRALGYFPTEYEIENLIAEAKYKVYQDTPSTEIDFEEFVKLYLNHRPAFGDSFKRLRNAFRNFAVFSNDNYVIPRDEFINMLSSYGERFSRELSWYLLSILSGHSFEDRANMTEDDFSFLPEEISFSDLVSNIIGIQDMDNVSEQFSAKGSFGSQQTMISFDSEEN